MELKIRWQRRADRPGQSCERCVRTLSEIHSAARKLRKAFEPLGVDVPAVEVSAAAADSLEANRVWLNDRPLEEWLKADVGRSSCCDAFGKHECRALYIKGRRYEVVPEELLVKAGLMAGAKLLGPKEQNRPNDRHNVPASRQTPLI
ncbi:MAG TPA: DUF2703 domain-containing protein [Verrucomicrobiae bacterium]|jgi:uncharacterized protein DUF2703|nr:DUF2703 domain-containing protein [Verrucomicrobiae bacterium]